ncbi:MAG: RNA 2',3'-cyclic phosphodiesterase [Polaromonas sp.]|uniref:RNA 2',3'-cyclic phosphodiesterase n=1 Tax=Polaromonas sp. TaxID=1869339 RepID=UPI0027309CC8|nr:RNA 2',3'-cyclic phosphodiesterase [Polaromonas sp.]MDP2449481.1 RNA 2',3'-cyclic phosphodiesterase [Polaromonas sp.]MDP3246587.1 RNA 2',3'-cyclic phosphodiesterase [Polaromonas sp.]MDP3757231.1 RNA 2',3'-cyclic phosphodiesterase [Polaromonas sp.]MDP3825567.1 RNA 2',3'-cyclic phosphodiesterase [Polaromonas sp.]
MPEQSFLPGFEAAPRPTDRLFFAIYPDAAAAAQIARLAQQLRAEHGLQGKPLKPERFHVTLHHLGDYAGLPQDLVAAACGAAASVAAAPFDVTFDRVASFTSAPRNRPFVLRGDDGLAPLAAFQQSLGEALKKTVLGRWAKPGFTPHVTLLYDDRSVPAQAVTPVSWTAREFVLVHSLMGQTLHVPLARWPLHA